MFCYATTKGPIPGVRVGRAETTEERTGGKTNRDTSLVSATSCLNPVGVDAAVGATRATRDLTQLSRHQYLSQHRTRKLDAFATQVPLAWVVFV